MKTVKVFPLKHFAVCSSYIVQCKDTAMYSDYMLHVYKILYCHGSDVSYCMTSTFKIRRCDLEVLMGLMTISYCVQAT